MSMHEKLSKINLPTAPPKGGVYTPVKLFGANLAYVSGCGPNTPEETFTGRLGREITMEDGCRAAANCMLNILAVLQRDLGSLDRVKQFVKMTVFVASADDFHQQPQVANAATTLLVDLFGEEAGCTSRSAVGVNALPANFPVEIEVLVELN